MRSRTLATALAALLALAAGGCGPDAEPGERAACRAARFLLAAHDRETLRGRVDDMVDQSRRAGNDRLASAAEDYEKALDASDVGKAEGALGRFYDECERLGLEVPGD